MRNSSPTFLAPVRELYQLGRAEPCFWRALAAAMAAALCEVAAILGVGAMLWTLQRNPAAGREYSALPDLLRQIDPLYVLLPGFVALAALRWWVRRVAELSFRRIEHGVVDRVRTEMLAGLYHAQWRWLMRQRRSDLVEQLINCGKLGEGLFAGLQAIGAGLNMLALAVLAAVLSWPLFVVGLIGCALQFAALHPHFSRAVRSGGELNRHQRAVHRMLHEGIANLRLIQLLSREAAELEGFAREVATQRAAQLRFNRARVDALGHGQLSTALLITLLIGIGHGAMSMPAALLLPLVLATLRIAPLLERVATGWQGWLLVQGICAANRDLLHELDGVAAQPADGECAPRPLTRAIRLQDVVFAYAPDRPPALRGISFTLPARTTTAIVGQSGAGKSTLADILAGLVQPDHGALIIDGVPLDSAERRAWSRNVAYLDQHHGLFYGTIRQNLLAARSDASAADIEAALAAAAADFVAGLPDGIDAWLGENGVALSGGQRQRIALARALIARPHLLILDEATSALDPRSEQAVAGAIARLHGQTTIVLLGHAGWITALADQVVDLTDLGRAA